MNVDKLLPWNWFKHEDSQPASAQIPISYRESLNRSRQPIGQNGYPVVPLQQQFDRLFEEVFNGVTNTWIKNRDSFFATSLGTSFQASIDIAGSKESYEITLDVPGMQESDLSIHLSGNLLQIRGEKQEKADSQEKHFYRTERRYGAFERSLSLPEDANVDAIKASLNNGVLSLVIPRKAKVTTETKTITIN